MAQPMIKPMGHTMAGVHLMGLPMGIRQITPWHVCMYSSHAAAHKHLRLMSRREGETGLANNLLGMRMVHCYGTKCAFVNDGDGVLLQSLLLNTNR